MIDNSRTRWNVAALGAVGIAYAPGMLAPTCYDGMLVLQSASAEALKSQLEQFEKWAQEHGYKYNIGETIVEGQKDAVAEDAMRHLNIGIGDDIEAAFEKTIWQLGVTTDIKSRMYAVAVIKIAGRYNDSFDADEMVHTISLDAAADEFLSDPFMARIAAISLELGWNDALDAAWNALDVKWQYNPGGAQQNWDRKLLELEKHRFNFRNEVVFEFSDDDIRSMISNPNIETISAEEVVEGVVEYVYNQFDNLGVDTEELQHTEWAKAGFLKMGLSPFGILTSDKSI